MRSHQPLGGDQSIGANEAAIHQQQRLAGTGGHVANTVSFARFGKIERLKHPTGEVAHDRHVYAPIRIIELPRAQLPVTGIENLAAVEALYRRGGSRIQFQYTADIEHRVSHRLRFQAA